MNGSEIISIVISILGSFLMGAVGMLFMGGRTALNYLIVKASRGSKVLMFAKTKFGWRSFVAKKDEDLLRWSYDKKKKITTLDGDDDLSRYMRIDMVFVDADKPLKAIKLQHGKVFPEDFDPETFNNLLIRAMTRPSTDGLEEMKKMMQIIIALVVLIGLGVLFLYFKVNDLSGGAVHGAVI